MASDDRIYMERAMQLAAMAHGRTSPNPMVGAVIVRDNRVVGEGYHRKAGTPHAEVHALNQAGSMAQGATMYVTLEPCSHHGRTPPCAEAIVVSGIKRVVAACLDPNPKVSGKGVGILQEAGLEVEVGVLAEEARQLNEVFFKYIQTGLPFVTLKTAMTLDGKIAASSGDSRWITGDDSRRFVHQLRNVYDGIMVGAGTVRADDPSLNTRLEDGNGHDPVRIIIDGELEIPFESQIVRSGREQRTIVFTALNNDEDKIVQLRECGLEVIGIPTKTQQLSLPVVLKHLAQLEICSILLEGGGNLNAQMLQQGLVDKVHWFIAPKIIGGEKAPGPVGGRGLARMGEALQVNICDVKYFEKDILLTGYLVNGSHTMGGGETVFLRGL